MNVEHYVTSEGCEVVAVRAWDQDTGAEIESVELGMRWIGRQKEPANPGCVAVPSA